MKSGTPTISLLLAGGDARLALDPQTLVNKYGCGAHPDPELITFGSSTGTTISGRGLAAAEALHQKLSVANTPDTLLYAAELERIRTELNQLCEINPDDAAATIFAASGTDLHLICAQLIAAGDQRPLHIIMMEGNETGSGVSAALQGRHFSHHAALGGPVASGTALDHLLAVQVSSIALRHPDGRKRDLSEIDADTDRLVKESLEQDQRILLIMIDVSKTGLIAPSPALMVELLQRCPTQLNVLVDACQFRLTNQTLRAYLKLGCMVCLTGSKFLTGPVFSGVLQIPPALTGRLARHRLPDSLTAYSCAAEWPAGWRAGQTLSQAPNWGLLLRLEAALAELRAFRRLSEPQITAVIDHIGSQIRHAVNANPCLELMAESRLDRTALGCADGWDSRPTIFPFLLRYRNGQPLERAATQRIYRQLQERLPADSGLDAAAGSTRFQLGQPVLCGQRDGIELSALRLCLSSRMIVEACEAGAVGVGGVVGVTGETGVADIEIGTAKIINHLQQALNKTSYLISTFV